MSDEMIPVPSEAVLEVPSEAVLETPSEAVVDAASNAMPAAMRLAEAVVFAATQPVTPRVLAQILPDAVDVDTVMAALTAAYAERGVNLVQVAGGWQFRTAPDIAPHLRKVVELPRRLPRVAMETLAIVAYHQPVTRPEVEEIRGAALSQNTLDLLLENGLITPKGRKESPGRPTLWGTTPAFLAQFGLNDLRDLPKREELLIDPTGPALKEQAPVLSPRADEAQEEPEAELALEPEADADSGPESEVVPPEEDPAE
jgi:segregation and condensation protein B